jgi:apolipoprotein N-acyltransferase
VVPWLLALLGGLVSVLAYPPFGPGLLIVGGVALFLAAVRVSEDPRQGVLVSSVYALGFFGGLLWWLSELELLALVLVPAQALYFVVFGWWLSRQNHRPPVEWVSLAVGGWALTEVIRYRFPVGGFEWGAAGYALSDNIFTRLPASVIGTSGLTVLVVILGAVLASAMARRFDPRLGWSAVIVLAVLLSTGVSFLFNGFVYRGLAHVAVVQGSTPCPFEHCPPDERLRTFEQHLELTRTLAPGTTDLVVWSEGSTGSFNADPVQNPEVGEAIAEEARRIGAWFLVGSDRPISDTHWVNANVVFTPEGDIVGEYRKQHPVPFGEYIPWRPLFDWIQALDQVPRDMIPGDGPVVFDVGDYWLGSVISFEGGFARYALQHRRAGADIIVVATNEGSYGLTPASDQFIGMTRMRAAELGVPLVHAAVTGKSTVVDPFGDIKQTTGLGTAEILIQGLTTPRETPFTVIGDLLMYLAVVIGAIVWWGPERLVGSTQQSTEEE